MSSVIIQLGCFFRAFFRARARAPRYARHITRDRTRPRQNNLVRPFWTRADRRIGAMIGHDAHRSRQFAHAHTARRFPRDTRASSSCVRFSLSSFLLFPRPSLSADPPVSLSSPCPPLSLSLSATDSLVTFTFHGQFNRSCAAGCAKWSCVLGDKWDTWFLDRGISPRTSLFVRECARSRRTSRSDWPRLA